MHTFVPTFLCFEDSSLIIDYFYAASNTPTDEAALAATALDVKINVQSFIIICRLNVTVALAQVSMICNDLCSSRRFA